ncbi:YdiU family protein [Kiloniella sp. EL199]|uniref:protein adenylyltransferase SelO n=1 Tax=Kiloniella sp. EL199 TaxID=2107581 RepID=UPI000EA2979E|nr:YdiU family protein [Kiloniella sp. EL199]
MTARLKIPFDNSFAQLPDQFYTRQDPVPVTAPRLIKVNEDLATLMGIDPDSLKTEDGVQMLAGNNVPDGASPLAMVYAGHQFGGWSPRLGDGRAILLGETVGIDGVRRDIHLKGSGRTPYSRGGDGRAWLGPVLREYIISEAMAALDIPTTRALAAVETGNKVLREEGPLPGAIITRVAQSHIRVGTFQYHYSRGDKDALRTLANYVIDRHYPEAKQAHPPYRTLIEMVMDRQARLIAKWMQVGFIHGVMNTDNMSVAGETIDFGPCAFMDTYHPGTVFSSIDHAGRYAWAKQPGIAQWNLSQFAQSLLPILHEEAQIAVGIGQETIDEFQDIFSNYYFEGFGKKLGLITLQPGDPDFIGDTLKLLSDNEVDFTLFFRHLTGFARSNLGQDQGTQEQNYKQKLQKLFKDPEAFNNWLPQWQSRQNQEKAPPEERLETMRTSNPIFIPRNHQVEAMIQAAVAGDYGPFERLHSILSAPFNEQPDNARYEQPPKPEEIVHATFCGT